MAVLFSRQLPNGLLDFFSYLQDNFWKLFNEEPTNHKSPHIILVLGGVVFDLIICSCTILLVYIAWRYRETLWARQSQPCSNNLVHPCRRLLKQMEFYFKSFFYCLKPDIYLVWWMFKFWLPYSHHYNLQFSPNFTE